MEVWHFLQAAEEVVRAGVFQSFVHQVVRAWARFTCFTFHRLVSTGGFFLFACWGCWVGVCLAFHDQSLRSSCLPMTNSTATWLPQLLWRAQHSSKKNLTIWEQLSDQKMFWWPSEPPTRTTWPQRQSEETQQTLTQISNKPNWHLGTWWKWIQEKEFSPSKKGTERISGTQNLRWACSKRDISTANYFYLEGGRTSHLSSGLELVRSDSHACLQPATT